MKFKLKCSYCGQEILSNHPTTYKKEQAATKIENHEIFDQIQQILTYISESEHKLALDAKFESTAYFHRGRQLLAVDILKSINSIFSQGK